VELEVLWEIRGWKFGKAKIALTTRGVWRACSYCCLANFRCTMYTKCRGIGRDSNSLLPPQPAIHHEGKSIANQAGESHCQNGKTREWMGELRETDNHMGERTG